jgi:hypothetical protein
MIQAMLGGIEKKNNKTSNKKGNKSCTGIPTESTAHQQR